MTKGERTRLLGSGRLCYVLVAVGSLDGLCLNCFGSIGLRDLPFMFEDQWISFFLYVGSLLFILNRHLPYSSRPRTLTNFIDNISGAAWSSSFHCFPFPSFKRKTCLSSSNGFFGNAESWVCNNLSSCCLINWAPSLLRRKFPGIASNSRGQKNTAPNLAYFNFTSHLASLKLHL